MPITMFKTCPKCDKINYTSILFERKKLMNERTNLGLSKNAAYILIYLIPIVGSVLFLLFDFKDRELRLHCLQDLYLSLAEVIAIFIFSLMGRIPVVGWLFTLILSLVSIVYGLICIIALVRALNGGILKVPFFYDLAYRGSY